MALRWCPGKPRPRSASSGGCGGGAPGRSGLLLWKRPWQLPAPSLCGLGWLAALPVSLQQQNQGQSSWLPLHLSVVCLWVSCLSLCASVCVFISFSLASETSTYFPLLSSFLSVSGSLQAFPLIFFFFLFHYDCPLIRKNERLSRTFRIKATDRVGRFQPMCSGELSFGLAQPSFLPCSG